MSMILDVMFVHTLVNNILSLFCRITLKWMLQGLHDDKSTLVQVIAWCRQATSHYLNQCLTKIFVNIRCHKVKWVKKMETTQWNLIALLSANSFEPVDAYMHAPVGRSSLVHKMACALIGTKPKPMLLLWQSDPREQTSVKYQSDFKHFHSRKCIWNVICNTAAFCYCLHLLTLWVLKPKYSRWCRPIPWMLMFWLLASPGLWTAMVLTLHDKRVLIFYKKQFKLFIPNHYWAKLQKKQTNYYVS